MPVPSGGGTLPAWAPDLFRVAAYVPNRTLVGAVDGYGVVRRTFDETTHPDGDSVTLLLEDAVGWLLSATGTLDASIEAAAAGLVARRTAAWVEYSYFDHENDKQHAEALLRQTEVELERLVARNTDLTGVDPTTSADDVQPDVWWPAVADTWTC